jgi:hypothetical protein
MYTKDEIEEVPTGWSINILDPDGLIVAVLDFVMVPGQRFTEYVEGSLNCRADALLSHLNR